MKAVTAEEMRRIDAETIDVMGIPGETLMAGAGKAVAEFAESVYRGEGAVAVFCGSGNNGGDGFVAAFHLAGRGIPVEIFLAGAKEGVTPLSAVFLHACVNGGLPITEIAGPDTVGRIDFGRYDLIIDALLGTGFEGPVRAATAEIIDAVNASERTVLSVDMPSGLPSGGGGPEGPVVRAAYTVTIGLPKISLVTWPGREYTGEVHVADIGFPRSLLESDDLTTDLLDADYARARLAVEHYADSYKGDAGHLLLVGGFDCMEGAIMMSAMAAFEAGVGLATLLTTETARAVIAGKIPELMTRSFPVSGGPGAAEAGVRAFLDGERRYDALVIGPGMGRTDESQAVFATVMGSLPKSGIGFALVDGDGLYHLARYLEETSLPEGVSFVITPHFGEASRLLGQPVDSIKKNRFAAALHLGSRTGAVALLKGPATIVSDGKRSLINTTGNRALATAGSGDVLAGVVGSLLLRGIGPLEAAGIGAYLHGRAADLAVEASGVMVLKATDTVEYLRKAMAEL
ncbi:MAG TPA: NAD(P)H-hydrate dehydratase [Spirochaetota bacterium]|nr:NAD(P)H-hydrate dehydratase [Spirochaetota bacterium]